jgi:peptidoglycan/xylan/chitin deacetylase (PgdA/CDA1 family)
MCLVLLCGCGINKNNDTADSVLKEYLENIDKYDISKREYGSPASHIHMDDKIVIGILYPETEVAALNKEINRWIVENVEKFTREATESFDGINAAELTVAYESFYADETTASVVLTGTFIAPFMAHPVDIVRTFNVDLTDKRVFEAGELFEDEERQQFVSLIAQKAQLDKDDISENLLENAYLTDDEIVVVLERGRFLPMSDGTKYIEFKYDDIEHLLKKSFQDNEAELLPDEIVDSPIAEENIPETEIDPDKPMVALTFDDGPSAHTDRLLDIFARCGGKGTFFVLGNLIDSRKNTLKRIVHEDHEIGNHSWSHRQFTNLSEKEITDQIMMTRAKIYDVTGVDTLIVRPPYGALNDTVKAVGANVGVYFVNWSVDTLDWKSKNAVAVRKEIMNNISDGAIILCHDLHKTTVDAMETVIPELVEMGYQLVTVSELMKFSQKTLEAGKVFYRQ